MSTSTSAPALPPEPPVPAPLTMDEIKHFRSSLSPAIRCSTETWLVVLTSAIVSLGCGAESIIDLYHLALSSSSDLASSQRKQSLIQETLVKGSVIFGIPPALDTIFPLLEHIRSTNPTFLLTSDHFSRQSLLSEPISSLKTPAMKSLERVYRHNLSPILDSKMSDNMQDLKFLTIQINYGFTLSCDAVINWKLTELLVLAALVGRNCRAEVLWHMRGALRAGWSRDDVDSVRSTVKELARRLAVRTDKVPTLDEVKEDSND
ncbi:possible carboxymuconolactone decarboxylase [Pseudozyma hubeiensis SY62]|uniref:Possible carboxymuconolactone decarboxylase n=1 Tax=Pseudozyma hubeiensis (strain SY62) TaxID=1305764 RepID=R9PCV5_PSEHS|nr:possible carboxymuconolactone decarboxylase [Pseudozyma hubeiensis SY62]GAC95895.1 possible carboxymuconolactone decarboxylase [Pseudozyma hubeiensis SY62]